MKSQGRFTPVMEGLERDFQFPRPSVKVALNRWFKSRARNHLQANRSLAFQFEVTI